MSTQPLVAKVLKYRSQWSDDATVKQALITFNGLKPEEADAVLAEANAQKPNGQPAAQPVGPTEDAPAPPAIAEPDFDPTALSEFERMVLIFAPRCHQVYDPSEIYVTAEEWAKGIAREAIKLCHEKEDERTTMKIGAKVREVEIKVDADGMPLINEHGEVILDLDTNAGKKYVAGRYGIVLGNPATVEAELRPFEDFEHKFEQPKFATDDGYINPEWLEYMRNRKAYDPTYVEFLATLIYVRWYGDDGTKLESQWHIPEELEEISATDTDTRTPWQIDVDKWLAEQDALDAQEIKRDRELHGEPKCYLSYPSEKWQKYVRFDPENEDHLTTELLHPKRIFESEIFGKLLKVRLALEADAIIDDYFTKYGRLPQGVTALGARPPDDLNLPVSTIEDALIKKLLCILDMSRQSLQTTDPRAVIATTLASLQKLQSLDAKFPQPLSSKSLWGVLGDFVEIAYPTTVACREMLLYQMLPLIGVVLGDAYYLGFGSDEHFPSIFTLSIARTSDGKGQAWHACKRAIELVDLPSICMKPAIHSGCSSGEGLVRMLGGQIKLEGGHRKKVAIFNTEMSIWFVAQSRKDSSLSGYLRKAYDGDQLENYRSDSKKSAAADNYLLGFCGTITPKELMVIMPQMDWSNGAQNRFLWSIGMRDKNLGRSTKSPDFGPWSERVKKLVILNANIKPTAIEYSESGKRVWDDWHYSLPEHDDTILADSQARVAANCARVANLYAQLDERRLSGWKVQLEAQHIEAAIEIVDRSRQSVEWYLTQQMGSTQKASYEDVQKLKNAVIKKVRSGGVAELTGTEVYELFRHRSRDQRDEICMAAGFKPGRKTLRGGLVWI